MLWGQGKHVLVRGGAHGASKTKLDIFLDHKDYNGTICALIIYFSGIFVYRVLSYDNLQTSILKKNYGYLKMMAAYFKSVDKNIATVNG